MLDRQQLNTIKVASPCTASWEKMKGDDQVRHCGDCNLNVYNLSAMSLDEVSKLLAKKEGRTCVRFYRRADGTVITDDCPVGLAKVRRKLAMMSATAAALLGATVAGVTLARGAMARTLRATKLAKIPVVLALADWMEPLPPPVVMMGAPRPLPPPPVQPAPVQKFMGKVAMPSPRTACQTTPEPAATMGEPEMIMGDVVAPAELPSKK